MPETISNTSPIQYLYQADLLELLPALYGAVIIPGAVAQELAAGREAGVYPFQTPASSPGSRLNGPPTARSYGS